MRLLQGYWLTDVMKLISNNEPNCPVGDVASIQGDVSTVMADVFQQARNYTTTLLEAAINGDGMDLTLLPGYDSSNSDPAISQFFANGKWMLYDNANPTAIANEHLGDAIGKLRQSLVGTVLKATNVYVWINTGKKTVASCGKWDQRARWYNEKCYILSDNPDGKIARQSIDSLGSYGVKIDDVYQISDSCMAAHPDGDGTVDYHALPTDGSLPNCFYNLIVISAKHPMDACDNCPYDDGGNDDDDDSSQTGWQSWCKVQCADAIDTWFKR